MINTELAKEKLSPKYQQIHFRLYTKPKQAVPSGRVRMGDLRLRLLLRTFHILQRIMTRGSSRIPVAAAVYSPTRIRPTSHQN